GDGVRDIAEFQVEEDIPAAIAELRDDGGTGGVVQLHANLHPTADPLQPAGQSEGFGRGGQVEGYDQAVSRSSRGAHSLKSNGWQHSDCQPLKEKRTLSKTREQRTGEQRGQMDLLDHDLGYFGIIFGDPVQPDLTEALDTDGLSCCI